MAPITLDDIVHYRPSAKKSHHKPLQAPIFHPHIYSESSSDRSIPSHPFPPNQHWRSSVSLPAHSPYPQSLSYLSGEAGTSFHRNKSAEEVAFDCSDESGMEFSNVHLNSDAVSNVRSMNGASRDVSNTGLLPGLHDQCDEGTW